MLLPLDAAEEEESVQDPSLSGPEEQILTSWIGNAAAWVQAVKGSPKKRSLNLSPAGPPAPCWIWAAVKVGWPITAP